jgi:hypothetical protein
LKIHLNVYYAEKSAKEEQVMTIFFFLTGTMLIIFLHLININIINIEVESEKTLGVIGVAAFCYFAVIIRLYYLAKLKLWIRNHQDHAIEINGRLFAVKDLTQKECRKHTGKITLPRHDSISNKQCLIQGSDLVIVPYKVSYYIQLMAINGGYDKEDVHAFMKGAVEAALYAIAGKYSLQEIPEKTDEVFQALSNASIGIFLIPEKLEIGKIIDAPEDCSFAETVNMPFAERNFGAMKNQKIPLEQKNWEFDLTMFLKDEKRRKIMYEKIEGLLTNIKNKSESKKEKLADNKSLNNKPKIKKETPKEEDHVFLDVVDFCNRNKKQM